MHVETLFASIVCSACKRYAENSTDLSIGKELDYFRLNAFFFMTSFPVQSVGILLSSKLCNNLSYQQRKLYYTLFFFYKNLFYKNFEAEISRPKF